MLQPRIFSGIAGPTILVSLMLFGLCVISSLYIYHQQRLTASSLEENLDSRRAAHDLENTLNDLLAQLIRGSREVEGIQDRLRDQLVRVKDLADKNEEKSFVGTLEKDYGRYMEIWQQSKPLEPADNRKLIAVAESMLTACRGLHRFDSQQIEESEEDHDHAVRLMAWGLLGVGTVASLAGILLGVAVTRSYRRSIHQLSIQVRDATGYLGQDVTRVTLSENGDLQHLHGQMHILLDGIEKTVRRLQDREREVLRAEQLAAVGQLASGAAHELRNPLTAIKMLVQTMREEADERQLPGQDIDVLSQEVLRMERCLQAFLDFARPPKLRFGRCALADVVGRTLALLGGRARNQRVELTFVPPEQPLVIVADADQIQQLLVNLVLNALDALPRGGKIEVEAGKLDADRVRLRVSDTGGGIPEDLLPRLFEPFVSSKETGLGLGLVVSRRIAEAHGGTLFGENRAGGGARFTLLLPMSRPAPDHEPIGSIRHANDPHY